MNTFMSTVSVFPSLLTFGLIAPALLRITVGIIGIIISVSIYNKFEKVESKSISIPYFITGIFLIIGMYTQVFALVGIALIFLKKFIDKKSSTETPEAKILKVIIGVVLLSLLFTGPGFMAIDYPL